MFSPRRPSLIRRSLRSAHRGLHGVTLGLSLLAAAASCETSSNDETQTRIKIDAQRYRAVLFDDDLAMGAQAPLVTIVVFTDYACPPCGRTWTVMDHLVEHYGADVRVVFRSYTVPGFGKGEQAAEAAFAAGAQGKFWEMHRRLFEHLGQFERPMLRAHAQALGLDVPRFMDDLDTGAHAGARIRHRREATRLGIVGLPAVFINGLYVAGYADENTWRGIVNEEIAHAKEMMAGGTPRADLYSTLMNSASTKRVTAPKGSSALAEDLSKKKAAAEKPLVLNPPRTDVRYRLPPGPAPQSAPDAPIHVVEFVDFQCPYCRRAWAQELAALKTTHGKEVSFEIRQLPLPAHTSAKGAARASLAAARQDKFWPYHDALITHSGEIGRDVFVELAGKLGLDVAKFTADFDDPKLAESVEAEIVLANELGVDATPAFLVNGRFVSGFKPGRIEGMVNEELEAVKTHRKAGLQGKAIRDAILADAVVREGFPN